MDSLYRAYIKDALDLTQKPKAFMKIVSGSPAGDILTRSNSSFECLEDIPDNVKEGDVFCLYENNGKVVYHGVIESKEEKRINTSQIYSLFDSEWFYRLSKQDYLEHEIADIFNDFMSGRIGTIVSSIPAANQENFEKNLNYYILNSGSYREYRIFKTLNEDTQQYEYSTEWIGTIAASDISSVTTDALIARKFGVFDVSYIGSQTSHLHTTNDVSDTRNMEDFIYNLFKTYGVVIEIEIPYEGRCSLNIKTADYAGTKIAKNTANIISITPKTETEETNKLVIMSSIGAYRKSYFATTMGIVESSDNVNRLPVVNTRIVFTDDGLADTKNSYLKEEMYNHEIIFEMFLDNNIYDFNSWPLGMPLEIYYKGTVYNTIYTGYSYDFNESEKPDKVQITCGNVRTKLTDLLNMKSM